MTARHRLFAAARDIFEREGLDALSIREVGRRAGLSAMAIYRHFPDKDALVDALLEDGFAAWEAIALGLDREEPTAWLRALLAAYGDFAVDQPHRFDAAFLLRARKARTYPDDVAAGRSPVVSLMMTQIERAQGQGRMKAGPPLQIALSLSALAQGLVSMHRAGRFGDDAKFHESYAAVIGRVLEGFLEPGGPAADDRQGGESE